MIPNIEFRYSSIYDLAYKRSPKILAILAAQKKKYPSPKEISDYTKKIQKYWDKNGNTILKELKKQMKLSWQDKEIKCYIIGKGRCFSDPLTMRMFDSIEDFIDALTHELIHQLQSQNKDKMRKWWKFIDKKFKDEPESTKNHILLQAVLFKTLSKLYPPKRIERAIRNLKSENFKKSWHIVLKESPEKIINKFHELSK